MRNVRTIAAGIGIAGALGIAALGIGAGTAGAEPPSPVTQADFAQIPEWGGPGPWRPGPGPWGPPPPPPPAWGYGGYAPGPPCISGPLGFLQFCP
ncbi:MAG: hypothetical protein QOF31_599 [Mycobacterium sp.]|nr:hypothetical protein [Mycobacterium sp.]